MLGHMNDPACINADHCEFYYVLPRLRNATGRGFERRLVSAQCESLRRSCRLHGRLAACSSFSDPATPTGLIEPDDYLQ
jgi:hypothetical protein